MSRYSFSESNAIYSGTGDSILLRFRTDGVSLQAGVAFSYFHFERSEESPLDSRGGKHTNEERFFASLMMTTFWILSPPVKP